MIPRISPELWVRTPLMVDLYLHSGVNIRRAQMIRFLPFLRFTFEGDLLSSRALPVNLREGGDHDGNAKQVPGRTSVEARARTASGTRGP
jgi:hypothetical protein